MVRVRKRRETQGTARCMGRGSEVKLQRGEGREEELARKGER